MASSAPCMVCAFSTPAGVQYKALRGQGLSPTRACSLTSASQIAARSPRVQVSRRRVGHVRMARYQRKEESAVPGGVGPSTPELSPEDKLVVSEAKAKKRKKTTSSAPTDLQLPTLSSLSTKAPKKEKAPEPEPEPKPTMMGSGLSAAEELQIVVFLKEVLVEFKQIEWPTASRVIKLTLLVIATILVASAGIYAVDGVLYGLSQRLFETTL